MAMIRTADHLETCINAIARAFRHLERMQREHKAVLQLPREFWGAVRSRKGKIVPIRNCTEHMENDLYNVPRRKPIALRVTSRGDAAEVGKHTLLFSDLAQAIRQLHARASQLAQYREEPTGASEKS